LPQTVPQRQTMGRCTHARSTHAARAQGTLGRTGCGGPNVYETPRSFSPQPVTLTSGSDQSRSQSKPVSGTCGRRAPPRVGGRTGRSKPRGAAPCPMPRAAAASPSCLPCISPASPASPLQSRCLERPLQRRDVARRDKVRRETAYRRTRGRGRASRRVSQRAVNSVVDCVVACGRV